MRPPWDDLPCMIALLWAPGQLGPNKILPSDIGNWYKNSYMKDIGLDLGLSYFKKLKLYSNLSLKQQHDYFAYSDQKGYSND